MVVLIAFMSVRGLAFAKSLPSHLAGQPESLSEKEQRSWRSTVHGSEFSDMSYLATHAPCEATRPPQALATPDPLLDGTGMNDKASVSFIVGTDGRVHSALILESAGPNEDRTILDAMHFWRYRPALCNGAPTEAEAKVEFSSR